MSRKVSLASGRGRVGKASTTKAWSAALAAGLILALHVPVRAGEATAPPPSRVGLQRHHYVMNARVRPLLLFWIARENVGDAVIARFAEAGRSKYSLLIGSDPERA